MRRISGFSLVLLGVLLAACSNEAAVTTPVGRSTVTEPERTQPEPVRHAPSDAGPPARAGGLASGPEPVRAPRPPRDAGVPAGGELSGIFPETTEQTWAAGGLFPPSDGGPLGLGGHGSAGSMRRLRIGAVTNVSEGDGVAIRRGINRSRRELEECLRGASSEVSVRLRFGVDARGLVEQPSAEGSSPPIRDCVVGVVRGASIPRPQGSAAIQAELTLSF